MQLTAIIVIIRAHMNRIIRSYVMYNNKADSQLKKITLTWTWVNSKSLPLLLRWMGWDICIDGWWLCRWCDWITCSGCPPCICVCKCCCFSSCLISSGLSNGDVDNGSMNWSVSHDSNLTCVAVVPSMMAFSGSMFCIELVISSHNGGRRNDSSSILFMQM